MIRPTDVIGGTYATAALESEKRTAGQDATEEFNMIHPTEVIGGTYATAAVEAEEHRQQLVGLRPSRAQRCLRIECGR